MKKFFVVLFVLIVPDVVLGYGNQSYVSDDYWNKCPNVNECSDLYYKKVCNVRAICTDTPCGYTCACKQGWEGDGKKCVDINECIDPELNKCDINATCLNNPGSYSCICNTGWEGDGTSCSDIDGCILEPCFPGVVCNDVPAPGTGRTCLECPPGYEGDGEDCIEHNLNGLIAYWTFDIEDQYQNMQGNNLLDGVPVGGDISISGIHGEKVRGSGALSISSSSTVYSYLDVQGSLWNAGQSKITVSAWYMFQDMGNNGSSTSDYIFKFLPQTDGAVNPMELRIRKEADDEDRDLEWFWTSDDSVTNSHIVGPIGNDLDWHHVVIVWNQDDNNILYYHDGRLFDVKEIHLDPLSPIGASDGLDIGVFWDGFLDDIAIFDYELSSAQVWSLYDGSATPWNLAMVSPENIPEESVPYVDGSWSIVVFPDTQGYVRYVENYTILDSMSDWVVENKDTRNIQAVLTVGDLTNNHNQEQWEAFRASLSALDGQVPYILTLGNHDQAGSGSYNECYRCTLLNEIYGMDYNPLLGGTFEEDRLENAYYTFTAPDGRDMLLMALEWAPRQEAVSWANQVAMGIADGLEEGQFDDYTAIMTTHAYVYNDDLRYDWTDTERLQRHNPHNYSGTLETDMDGEQLWNSLIEQNSNFEFVFNGHVTGPGHNEQNGRGQLRSEITGTDHDHSVNQILFNTQILGNGGNGWMLLVEFLPNGNSVITKVYSPFLDSWRSDFDIWPISQI
jgi:hypothetical protein